MILNGAQTLQPAKDPTAPGKNMRAHDAMLGCRQALDLPPMRKDKTLKAKAYTENRCDIRTPETPEICNQANIVWVTRVPRTGTRHDRSKWLQEGSQVSNLAVYIDPSDMHARKPLGEEGNNVV
jgi:hypothetical protein